MVQIQKNPWMSRCVQTFDWCCKFEEFSDSVVNNCILSSVLIDVWTALSPGWDVYTVARWGKVTFKGCLFLKHLCSHQPTGRLFLLCSVLILIIHYAQLYNQWFKALLLKKGVDGSLWTVQKCWYVTYCYNMWNVNGYNHLLKY